MTWRRVSSSFPEVLQSLFECLAGTAGYAAIAIALVLIFARPSPRALADGFFPRDERRNAAILFWVPILLPIVPALIKNINLISLWNTPALNLLPVMLLGSPLVVLPRVAVLRIAGVALAITLISVALSPVIAFAILKQGVENNAAYARLVMQAADREWRATPATGGKPLKLIAGPFVLVSSASFYGADKPSTLAGVLALPLALGRQCAHRARGHGDHVRGRRSELPQGDRDLLGDLARRTARRGDIDAPLARLRERAEALHDRDHSATAMMRTRVELTGPFRQNAARPTPGRRFAIWPGP